MIIRLGSLTLMLFFWSLAGGPAAAQERPTATVLTSQLTDVEPGQGAAFDRTLRARLDALQVVRTEGAVALDLEQIQLALGCMGETTECLSAVATETGTPIIVVPSLAHAGSSIVATVLVFDGRDQSMRRGTRETSASDSSGLLAGVEGLLREVFGLPAETEVVDTTPPPVVARPGLSPVPIVVIAIGGAALVAGAIVGGLSLSDADAYRGMPLSTETEIDAAQSVLSRQQTEAIAADGLLIGGGVVAVAGLIWQMAAGNEDGSSPLAVAPVVNGTQVGLVVSGSFGGAL